MKYRQFTLEPETVSEKDGITALKLALEEYSRLYGKFFARGKLLNESEHVDFARAILGDVETDQYGRDANGIDIASALRTLEQVKGV